MARDRANLRTDLWADADWRSLTPGAQWLYLYLLSSSTLSYVGVADWRPARIAAMSAGAKASDVNKWGDELESARFAIRDQETEETVIRSFLRHDGALLNPNLWKSIGRDFAAVASQRLQRVIAVEVRRLRDGNPEGLETSKGGKVSPWDSDHLRTLLNTPSDTPIERVGGRGSERGSDRGCPTTTTTSTTTNTLSNELDNVKPLSKNPYPDDFEQWWQSYPRREAKGDALKAWKQLKSDRILPDVETLIAASETYARRETRSQFRKLPGGWLRGHKWLDEEAQPNDEPEYIGYRPPAPAPAGKRFAVDVATGGR